jgi:FKBP-type peptidyl-prolyl cis-trans isomerase
MSYADFTKSDSGLLFKDAKLGSGGTPAQGDRVVIEWTGYTIGYFGRPFETKQLKSLDGKDDVFLRFELGRGTVIPAIEQGVLGMAEGGVRQLVVPPSVGYPRSDPAHDKVGPKPSTFSGQRALNFVLENQELIDKTLLFNVKLIRVDKPGSNGWKLG